MSPESAAEIFIIPPIWTPEWGFHWNMVFKYLVSLYFFGGHAKDGIDTLVRFCKTQVNKIQFDLPTPVGVIRIDFSKYAWDDEFFDYLGNLAKMKINAKESAAKKLKVEYIAKMQSPGADTKKLHEEYQDELEKLTDEVIDNIKEFDPQLFKAAITRFGHEKAEEYIRNHVKSSVVEKKNGTAERVSMTATLKQLGTGNGSSNA